MSTFNVRLFSILRERVGKPLVEVPAGGIGTVADLVRSLSSLYPAIAPFEPVLRVAVNQEYATPDRRVRPGDEVAIITPTSGG